MKSLLTWLLLELNRQYRVEDENELYFTVGEKVKHKKIISEVLSYVDQRGRTLLRDTDMLITEIATLVGYNNITHFNAMFKKETGISPKEFRNQVNRRSLKS